MNIFRRFFSPGSKETESPSRVEEIISTVILEVGPSFMHQQDLDAGTPQSSQRGRVNDDDCVIEILSSDDERVACTDHGNEGKENTAATSSITNISDTGISKTTEDAIRLSAEFTTVPDLKPTASPLESTKSPSVTTTDTSNGYDDDGDEAKENAAATSRIDNTSDATASRIAPNAVSSLADLDNATDLKPKESPLESTELQSVTTTNNSKIYLARKRRRKRAKDSHAVMPSGLLSSSCSNANRTNNPHQVKRRKDPPQDSSNPPIRIVRGKNYSISSSLIASKEINEENPFAFPSETQCNNERQEMYHESKSAIESNNLNPSSYNTDSTKTGKRPRHDDSTEMMILPNKKQSTEEDSTSLKNDENSLKEDYSCDRRMNTLQDEEAQKPSESSEPVVESPVKTIPQFKLPPELAPFNNPGVCDYGVIRTSRLRNRRKKANAQEDVLYQNIQGQRRCRATRAGRKITGKGNTNRCMNCAEGVFKYCHTHRNLDEEQREFWEQRKQRESKSRPSPPALKAKMATKTKPQYTARSKTNCKNASESEMKCLETKKSKGKQSSVDDDKRCEKNDIKQCVFLIHGEERCSRNISPTQPGFCYGHAAAAQAMKTKRDEIFQGHPGTMRCTAVSKVGSECKFKALDQWVFCAKHIGLPPEKVSPIVFVADKKMKKEESSRKKGKNALEDADSTDDVESMGDLTRCSSGKIGLIKCLADGCNVASTTEIESSDEKDTELREEAGLITKPLKDKISKLHELLDPPKNVMGEAENNKTYPHKPTSESLLAEIDEVPKNIEFPRKIEIPKEQIELATSFDDMCFNIYKSKRCWYKRAEGTILCHECRLCHDEGKPFDHILNDDANRDERIILSNKCVKFDRGKQCQNMALEGKILCSECLQSWDETKKSSFEYLENSEASKLEMSGERMGSDEYSSETFSSDSDDSEDSRVSDDTNYDAYCTAYTHKEFFKMWTNWEKKTEKVDEVEDSRLIKRANNTMSPTDTDGQVKAQYGRVLPHAMKKMIKILELRREDIFLDIGHGVGNTCLHASFCTGCDSRGIEVVSDRHEIADKFRGGMYAEHNCGDPPRPKVGNVDLRLGRLEDPRQKDFLTKGVTRAYVNNFNGVFAERSSKNKDKWFLDDYISGIFASMAPGAIMVTFHPLNLGLDRDSANSLRTKHNLAESDHASYYDNEKIELGQAFCSVKWNKRSGNTNKIYVYKYRRLHQPGHHDAVFLCCNPSCKLATDMVPIPVTTRNEDGRCVINHCECKFSPKNLRKRSSKQLSP